MLALLAITLLIAGCVQLRERASPSAREVGPEWRELLEEVRAFQRRIGYNKPTKNFSAVATDRQSFPFCGQASRWVLPYSYQDPAIRWFDTVTEAQCRDVDEDTDVYFGMVEAMGEIGTPVTPAMLSSTLDRFIYLVVHEDCHDQFDLPYGIEEPLCNVITYRAMERFSSERFRWYSRDNQAIKRYAATQSRLTRVTVAYYDQLAALYARHGRAELSNDALLHARAALFTRAARALEMPAGELNNVVLANAMTYSRHYPYLERVFHALGRDLAHTIEYFQHVDRIKPKPDEVMRRHGITDPNSAAFLRAYEDAIVQTIGATLNDWRIRAAGTPAP